MPVPFSTTFSSANADLQTLVQELAKNNPDKKLIKNKSLALGIPYSTDLITLMSEVLLYLSRNNLANNASKNRKSYAK